MVVRVLDRKRKNMAITDGGNNALGWDYGEQFYYPIINLTHFSQKEIPFTLYGSLCTPRDVWGYYLFTRKVKEGDVMVIPNQGAYRLSLAQNFIKPIPKVYRI
jgi:diaminopimelate decarboxylase